MIPKEDLKKIMNEAIHTTGIERSLEKSIPLNQSHAIIISGIRRCGKSTLLKHIMQKLNGKSYLNFEDPRLIGFLLNDFEQFYDAPELYYFFDEIQNILEWERAVRLLLDKEKKIYITGSNASLLSKELGTKLTGRHLRYELYPFSYSEYLEYTNQKIGKNTLEKYLTIGGFPEYVKENNPLILQELFQNIIVRDIAIRFKFKNIYVLKAIASYLLTNISKEFTYNKLKKLFGLGSTNTVISMVSHFEDSYMLFAVPQHNYSLKKQLVNPKKIYCIDTGFYNVNTKASSEDYGKIFENLIFIELKRRQKEIYYHKGNRECDFLIKKGIKIVEAIQVSAIIHRENIDREIDGLMEAMKEYKLNEGLIITMDQEDTMKKDGKTIHITPAWKWLS